MASSACDYLNADDSSKLDILEFIDTFHIKCQRDIEELIIYAISYNKPNIICALFHPETGYVNQLESHPLLQMRMHVNSLYSTDCTSLIPSIKAQQPSDRNHLFSASTIDSSKRVEYDNQIEHPTECTITHQMYYHFLRTNAHCKLDHDEESIANQESTQPLTMTVGTVTIALKPCYLTYFDHCVLLGHYKIALLLLDYDAYHSFLNGNFMIFVREVMLKRKYTDANYKYYEQIVRNLYAMGADIDGVYINHQLRGFAYLYYALKDSRAIFEGRRNALAQTLQRGLQCTLDVCIELVSYVPYIDEKMTQSRSSHRAGAMILNRKL